MNRYIGNKVNAAVLISISVALFAIVIYSIKKSTVQELKIPEMQKNDALFEDFWTWRLKTSPEFATFIGNHEYDSYLESYSLQSFEDRKKTCEQFLSQANNLLSINEENLSKDAKLNLELFINELSTYLKGLEAKGYLFPINYLEGIHLELGRLTEAMQFKTYEDYEKLTARYRAVPNQIAEIIELLRKGVKLNMTYHQVSMKDVPKQIDQLLCDVKESPFYKPLLSIPDSIPYGKKEKIIKDIASAIFVDVQPSFKRLKQYLETEYFNSFRSKIGAFSLPGGDNFYQMCLDFHLGFRMTPQEVHDLGLKEVKRISAEMDKVIALLGLGTVPRKLFAEKMKADRIFYFKTEDELLDAYKGLVFNEIHPKLSEIIKHIPKLKLSIEPAPPSMANGPAAFYLGGTPDGSRPGIFYVNTANVNASPNYEMVTLALHEAEPGHHLQLSYMMELNDVPEFRKYIEDRKYSDAPSRFPLHTAYIEGWGLYSEYLGYELNMYDDLNFHYGHLSQEIFRACRLVVDTGIHALGWSKERALQYLVDNTAAHEQKLADEIDRYITWPGQACAYKVGEIKIKQLRTKAKNSLGPKFNVKDFHEVVLHSAGPLSLLEQKVDEYIIQTLNQI